MEDPYNLEGDLMVALDAVHETCDFIQKALTRNLDSQFTTHCKGVRPSPLQVAAQVLLTARIKRQLPHDSFIAEFRDLDRDLKMRLLDYNAVSDVMKLLAFHEKYLPARAKDYSLHRENSMRSHLDAAGKIHKDGIIYKGPPHASGRGLAPRPPDSPTPPPNKTDDAASNHEEHTTPMNSRPSGPKDSPASANPPQPGASSTRAYLNRVWVLEPMDDLASAMDGKPYCVSATLFRNGLEMLTVIGVPNQTGEKGILPLNHAYGEIYTAIKGRGAHMCALAYRKLGRRTQVRLEPRNQAMSNLEGHKAFPRIRVVVPAEQQSDSRGGLTPKQTLPAGKAQPPTSPRAYRWKEKQQPTFNDPPDKSRIDKWDMQSTGPKLESLLRSHVESLYTVRSSLLCYIAVATGNAHASISIPNSCLAHSDNFLWREAGGSLLLREAGGIVTDAEGQELDFCTGRTLRKNFGLLATCPGTTHWRLLDAIKGNLVVDGGDIADKNGGIGAGRWATGYNLGPWACPEAKREMVTRDHGKPALLPRDEDGNLKPLLMHTFRYYTEWPRARATWMTGRATGQWVKEAGKAKRIVQAGHSAVTRYLPEHIKTVKHDGPCKWPCAQCEPEEFKMWCGGSVGKEKSG